MGIWYFNIFDWPMNIGGKPSQALYKNLPAFIPVIFEFTVLCAAHGMVITYLIRNKTLPGMPARNPDPRTTDDKFIIEVRTADNHGHSAEAISGPAAHHSGVRDQRTPVLTMSVRASSTSTYTLGTVLAVVLLMVPAAAIPIAQAWNTCPTCTAARRWRPMWISDRTRTFHGG
jgi:hypothetical protein